MTKYEVVLIPSIRSKSQNRRKNGSYDKARVGLNPFYQV